MPDSCVSYEAAFIRNNSENVWCPVLIFRPSIPLIWCLGPHSCIFDKLSGEVSYLRLSKNVKVMFIFNKKTYFAYSTKFSLSTCFL